MKYLDLYFTKATRHALAEKTSSLVGQSNVYYPRRKAHTNLTPIHHSYHLNIVESKT